MPAPLSASLRAAVRARDLRSLASAARAAGPRALAAEWPKLNPLARVAAFRALGPKDAAALFASLSREDRWLAYLGCVTEGAAPLLEGARPAARRLLRKPAASELAAMRKALAA